MTTPEDKQVIKSLKKYLGDFFPKGPKLDEITYELFFSSNPEEDMKTLEKGLNYRDFILSTNRLETFRTRVLENYDLNIRSSIMMEGNVKCRYCKSTDTIYALRQTRASDEAPTLILFCNACGRRSTAESSE